MGTYDSPELFKLKDSIFRSNLQNLKNFFEKNLTVSIAQVIFNYENSERTKYLEKLVPILQANLVIALNEKDPKQVTELFSDYVKTISELVQAMKIEQSILEKALQKLLKSDQ